jgi:23S rRNA pseudouridine2605 synthase
MVGTVLNKFIAQAGLCSRRKAVDIIKEGVVTVNGVVIGEPGYLVKNKDVVKVRSQVIKTERPVYILLNKPKNYVTTVADERGRRTVMDLVQDAAPVRLYPVGRLDRDTTGLLLMTNDGEFTQHLSHPRNDVKKIYQAVLDRPLTSDDMHTIRNGVKLWDGFAQFDAISYIPGRRKNTLMVTIHSGRNRIVRRLFEALEYKVKALDRVFYAGITKQSLPLGSWRYLTPDEVEELKSF